MGAPVARREPRTEDSRRMTMATSWLTRVVRALRLRSEETSPESEMDEEMAFHLEMATRRNVERGMPPDEARRHALATFGGVAQTRESAHDGMPGRRLDELRQNLG